MSDIFREVDEDIRQERYRRLWDRFGPWVILLAALIVVGTAGYRGWDYYRQTQADAAGTTFQQAVAAAEAGNLDEARELLDSLSDAAGGYPELARMRAAGVLAQQGSSEDALAAFDALSRDTSLDKTLRDVAALRAAYIAADTADYAAVADRAEPLTGDANPFRASAREILAVAAWKAGDVDRARDWLDALNDDTETPTDVSRRVALLNDLILAAHGEAMPDSATAGDAGESETKAPEGGN